MGIIATAVKHLIAAGVTGDALVAAVAELEAEAPVDRAAENRRAYDRERKAILRDGQFAQNRAILFSTKPMVCAYCSTTEGPFHADHIVPLSRGGTSNLENLCVACAPCNLSKGNSEWGADGE